MDPRIENALLIIEVLLAVLLTAGVLIDLLGFVPMATIYGVAGIACTLLIALHWHAALWPSQAPANAR